MKLRLVIGTLLLLLHPALAATDIPTECTDIQDELDPLLEEYEDVRESLAEEESDELRERMETLEEQLDRLNAELETCIEENAERAVQRAVPDVDAAEQCSQFDERIRELERRAETVDSEEQRQSIQEEIRTVEERREDCIRRETDADTPDRCEDIRERLHTVDQRLANASTDEEEARLQEQVDEVENALDKCTQDERGGETASRIAMPTVRVEAGSSCRRVERQIEEFRELRDKLQEQVKDGTDHLEDDLERARNRLERVRSLQDDCTERDGEDIPTCDEVEEHMSEFRENVQDHPYVLARMDEKIKEKIRECGYDLPDVANRTCTELREELEEKEAIIADLRERLAAYEQRAEDDTTQERDDSGARTVAEDSAEREFEEERGESETRRNTTVVAEDSAAQEIEQERQESEARRDTGVQEENTTREARNTTNGDNASSSGVGKMIRTVVSRIIS